MALWAGGRAWFQGWAYRCCHVPVSRFTRRTRKQGALALGHIHSSPSSGLGPAIRGNTDRYALGRVYGNALWQFV